MSSKPPPPGTPPPSPPPGGPTHPPTGPGPQPHLDDLFDLAVAVFTQSPARQESRRAVAAVPSVSPGGPVPNHPLAPGEELTPSSAAAAPVAVSGSLRPDTTPEAGASSGREKSARPDGGAPGVPQLPAVAAFANPNTRVPLSFGEGEHRLIGAVERT